MGIGCRPLRTSRRDRTLGVAVPPVAGSRDPPRRSRPRIRALSDWSAAFVEREWAENIAALPGRVGAVGLTLAPSDGDRVSVGPTGPQTTVLIGARRELLAWMLGRAERPTHPSSHPPDEDPTPVNDRLRVARSLSGATRIDMLADFGQPEFVGLLAFQDWLTRSGTRRR